MACTKEKSIKDLIGSMSYHLRMIRVVELGYGPGDVDLENALQDQIKINEKLLKRIEDLEKYKPSPQNYSSKFIDTSGKGPGPP